MNDARLLEKLHALPADKQAEVFDFVDYLAERFAHPAGPGFADWPQGEFSELAMAQAMRGVEDEPALYAETDLKARWQ